MIDLDGFIRKFGKNLVLTESRVIYNNYSSNVVNRILEKNFKFIIFHQKYAQNKALNRNRKFDLEIFERKGQ